LGGRARIRLAVTDEPAVTDQGLLLLDCLFGDPAEPHIEDPRELQAALARMPGVAEHGLFLDTTTLGIVADGEEIFVHTREAVFPLAEWEDL
jgi:ribose 5-phosphate isomerase A